MEQEGGLALVVLPWAQEAGGCVVGSAQRTELPPRFVTVATE